jgi:hypothetical protein
MTMNITHLPSQPARALLFLGLLGLALAAHADAPTAFVYRDPASAVAFTVTADGLSSIAVGARQIAAGGWYTASGEGIFNVGGKTVLAETLTREPWELAEKSLTIVDAAHARVRQASADVVTTFDYTFAGEDVTIRARVENNHATDALALTRFTGLLFTFGKTPTGLYPGGGHWWHYGALTNYGAGCMHPSFHTKIAGSYLTDGEVGIGATPWKTEFTPKTMLFWLRKDPYNKTDLRWVLNYFRHDPIPAGGAKTFQLRLRVSANTDWKHLLGPYKEYFLETYGPIRYKTDFRAMGVAHVNSGPPTISPANPYGFHPRRHLHTAEGVNAFCDMVIPGLKACNGQGMLIWGHYGSEPRGQIYRSDFDVIPPEVEANWPLLRKRFADAGLRLGVCARPSQFQLRLDWSQDGTYNLNAEDPQQLEMAWLRFKKMIDLGCTLFMLDSFGGYYSNDAKVMRYLRERMGPEIQTFSEAQQDVLIPFTGAYSEVDYWAPAIKTPDAPDAEEPDPEDKTPARWQPRTPLQYWELFQWLCPGVNIIVRRYDTHGPAPQAEDDWRFYYRHRMTPMLEDYTIKEFAPRLGLLQRDYLDGKGQWYPTPSPSP